MPRKFVPRAAAPGYRRRMASPAPRPSVLASVPTFVKVILALSALFWGVVLLPRLVRPTSAVVGRPQVYGFGPGSPYKRGFGEIDAFALSPDGTRLAMAIHPPERVLPMQPLKLRVVDTATGREVWETDFDNPTKTPKTTPEITRWNRGDLHEEARGLTWSPDGRSLVMGSSKGRLYVVSAADGRVQRRIGLGPGREVASFCFHRCLMRFNDEGLVLVERLGKNRSAVTLRSWPALRVVREYDGRFGGNEDLAPDGRTVVGDGPDPRKSVGFLDVKTGRRWSVALTLPPEPEGPRRTHAVPFLFRFDPTGRRLALGFANGRTHVVDARTGASLGRFDLGRARNEDSYDPPRTLAWSPDGRSVLFGGYMRNVWTDQWWHKNNLTVGNVAESGAAARTVAVDGTVPRALTFGPDGRLYGLLHRSSGPDEVRAWRLRGLDGAR